MSGLIAGVDVGGTFTDLMILNPATGQIWIAKVPTTLPNQAGGVLQAFDETGVDLADVALIVHGTTTTTNAVLERAFAKTGMITTTGFRDILELGRRTRPNAYGMTGQFTPVIPRDLRLEVTERIDAMGRIVTDLDEQALRVAVQTLLDQGCESLVIHFLHSYANPNHERRAAALAATLWPNDYITMGHALLSESREFERGVTAAVNAAVQPLLERYVRLLASELRTRGYAHDLLVMNGNGGMVSAQNVSREAVKTVMSGPASGVMAALATGRRAGMANLLTYDMGGTSTDVAMITAGRAPVSNEIEIEYAMPIHVPMVDVRTVGAGGGSIARVDASGVLTVGPDSAGSIPGPICYGRGGRLVTISDANLLLGRLPADRFGAAAAEAALAMKAQIGDPLGLDIEAAASAILRIANTHMAGAIRMVSISLGADPRDYVLFAFGGAGPLHATALARELGVPQVLIPARPGMTNALGCVVADLRHDFVRTLNRPLDGVSMAQVHDEMAEQAAHGRALIAAENVDLANVRVEFAADMQFIGQTHLLRIDLPGPTPSRSEIQTLFETAYFNRFKVSLPAIRANLVNLVCSVIGQRPAINLARLMGDSARSETVLPTHHRKVWFDGWQDVPVYRRENLPLTLSLTGPAIIEQMDTTVVIEPGCHVASDADGNLIVTVHHD